MLRFIFINAKANGCRITTRISCGIYFKESSLMINEILWRHSRPKIFRFHCTFRILSFVCRWWRYVTFISVQQNKHNNQRVITHQAIRFTLDSAPDGCWRECSIQNSIPRDSSISNKESTNSYVFVDVWYPATGYSVLSFLSGGLFGHSIIGTSHDSPCHASDVLLTNIGWYEQLLMSTWRCPIVYSALSHVLFHW